MPSALSAEVARRGLATLERRVGGACDHFEYWLVRGAARRIGEPRLLLGVCNDGYGASGVGDDVVEVSEKVP